MASELSRFAKHQMEKMGVPQHASFGREGCPCRVCSRPIPLVEFPYQQLGICSCCAEVISETFNMAHAGAYNLWHGRSA